MIISHRHKFIFFAEPRTGTHAVRAALAPHLDAADWQQQALTGAQHLPNAELARIGHGHISLRQLQAALPESIWAAYFKFAVVRNPYDRLVSVCAFLNRRNPHFAGREQAFMKAAMRRPRFRGRVLVRPQVELLLDQSGRLGMDDLGRFETLQADFDRICAHIGLPPCPLPHRNASQHGPSHQLYDAELLRQVTEFYRADLDQLGYPAARTVEELARICA